MIKKICIIFVAVLAIGLVVFLLMPKNGVASQSLKVGAILPLTGNVAIFGKWHQQGFEIANEQIVKEGILNGKNISIIYGDSRNEAKEGVSLFHKFVAIDRIPIVITAMSGVSKPLIPLAQKNGTLLFFIDVTYPDITKSSPLFFRHFVQSDREAEILAAYAVEKLKIKKCSIFYLDDETGLGAKISFKEEIEERGSRILSEERFTKDGTNFRTQVTKLISKEPEAIYVFGYGRSWTIAVKQLKEQGYKGKILANTVVWFPVFRKPLGKSADGIIFSMPNLTIDADIPSIQKFVRLYRSKHNADPPLEAAYAYDTLMMLARAIAKGGYGAEQTSNGLMEMEKFTGAFGEIEIDASGEIKTEIVIRTIKDGAIVSIE